MLVLQLTNAYKEAVCSLLKKIKDGKVYGKEYPEKFFDHLEVRKFKGKEYHIPMYVEEYLTYLYGDWKSKKPKGTSNLRELLEVKIA